MECIKVQKICEKCKGSGELATYVGTERDMKIVQCDKCKGRGYYFLMVATQVDYLEENNYD